MSATHRPAESPVARYKTFELDGLRVAVTGVSRDGLEYLRPAGTTVGDPVESLSALLPELRDHDVVVVLAYDVPKEVPALAGLPGVDVVIEASGYAERWPPLAVGDAVWVRSRDEGAELGELRLWVDDGRVIRAVDRRAVVGPHLDVAPRIDRLDRRQRDGEPLPRRIPVTETAGSQ